MHKFDKYMYPELQVSGRGQDGDMQTRVITTYCVFNDYTMYTQTN